jgi:triacylglycerol lipase
MPTHAFSLHEALSLARASKHAYNSRDLIHERYHADGYADCVVHAHAGSQVFIASRNDLTLISFRGTEATFGQWLRNLQVLPVLDTWGEVHHGFSSALDEVWGELRASLDSQQAASKRIRITGHSLGGAMAALCAARLEVAGFANQIECIYTFGQPRLAGRGFQSHFDSLFRDRYYRVVNQMDIVPRVPPGYAHVGTPKRITGEGGLEAALAGPLAELFTDPPEEHAGELFESDQAGLNEEQFALLRDYMEAVPEIDQAKVDDAADPDAEGLFDWATHHFMDSYLTALEALPQA